MFMMSPTFDTDLPNDCSEELGVEYEDKYDMFMLETL